MIDDLWVLRSMKCGLSLKLQVRLRLKKLRTGEKSLNQIGKRSLNLVRERKVHLNVPFSIMKVEVDGLTEKKDAPLLVYGGVDVGCLMDESVFASRHSHSLA